MIKPKGITATDYEALLADNQALKLEIQFLKEELSKLKRLIFGQKRERFAPSENLSQLDLVLTPEQEPSPEVIPTEQVTYRRKKAAKKVTPHGRNPLPAHLPRKEIIIEPEADTSGMKKIGDEITEELEYEPGKLYVKRYLRPKYAAHDGEGVVIGTLPTRPIEKGIAGPGLLAHVVISKYVDHLPLYRQRKQFLRHDVNLAASTLGDWVRRTCELLMPLYELQRKVIQQASYLMADETPIRVQDAEKKGKCHQGYYWVYHDPLARLVYFDYQQTRNRGGPEAMLQDFSGYLQTDSYQAYDDIGNRKTISHLGCFAHARRYFAQAEDSDPKRAQWMLSHIRKLYALERFAREQELSHLQRYELRQKEALPVLSEIETWLNEQRQQVLPKSSIGKAIAYMLKYWTRLTTYTTDGRLEIDNNLVENAIRPVALGRKNYLFAGSHDGARRAAVLYTLVTTAQLHEVEPFTYLKHVIAHISDHPYKQLDQLLPQNWKRTFPTHNEI
jgi:transposase